jgi:hypothetical protein
VSFAFSIFFSPMRVCDGIFELAGSRIFGCRIANNSIANHRWEKDQYFKAAEYQDNIQKSQQFENKTKPNEAEREAFEAEAKKLLDGSKPWRPTWQALGLNYNRSSVGDAKDIFPGNGRS